MSAEFYDIWPTLRHVGNMLTTFPTKIISMQLFVSCNRLFIYLLIFLPSFSKNSIVAYIKQIMLQIISDVFIDFCCHELLRHVCISTVHELFDVTEFNPVDSS